MNKIQEIQLNSLEKIKKKETRHENFSVRISIVKEGAFVSLPSFMMQG